MNKKSTLSTLDAIGYFISGVGIFILVCIFIFGLFVFYPNMFLSVFNPDMAGDITVHHYSDSNTPASELNVSTTTKKPDTHIFKYETDYENKTLYDYSYPTKENGEFYVNIKEVEKFLIDSISDDIAITIFKDDTMHHYRLRRNRVNQLLYLNDETSTAEVLYECYDTNRIIYGNKDLVIIFNGEKNAVQYISLSDNKILHEEPLNLNLRVDNSFTVYINENKLIVEQHRGSVFPWKTVAELPLHPVE